MVTLGKTAPASASDLLNLRDDSYRYELVRGQLVRHSPAGSRHGAVALHLGHLLWSWARLHDSGIVFAAETGYKLHSDPDTVRAPDVSFVLKQRIPAAGLPDAYFDGPPDLAVEVLSPDDRMVEVLDKVRDYLQAGVRQVWIVAPKGSTITIYESLRQVRVLTEDDTLVGTAPVEGFQLRVADLFA